MNRYNFLNRTAVVTGAASGIGAALAGELAARGAHLALLDIDADGLERTAAPLRTNSRRVSVHVLDLANAGAIEEFPEQLQVQHGGADLLINNAGAALGGTFAEVPVDNWEWLIDVNFYGTVRMTRALMPMLQASGGGYLCNISSVYGIVAPPGQTAYSASKFAVRGFTEALRHELVETDIGISLVHPGGIKTNIARNARMSREMPTQEREAMLQDIETMFKTTPEDAARTILSGIERRRPRILIGNDARFIVGLERFFPTTHMATLRRFFSPRKSRN